MHFEPLLLQVDDHAFALFIRIFANVLSAVSTTGITSASSASSAPAATTCYSICFNANFTGFSVELSLDETISGRFSSRMSVVSSFSHDSFKIVSKCEDMRVALLQRAADGSHSTVQQLLERTFFNFSVKSDSPSSEYCVILSFLSPIVCNTSYTDIKRLYFTFELFLSSFNSGMQSSRLSKNAQILKVAASSSSLTPAKLSVCLQADSIRLVFVNDCPPFCAPLLERLCLFWEHR